MSKYSVSYHINDDMLRQMIELDKQVYHYGDIGNFDLCKNWLSKNDEIYTALLDDGEVVGYINFMPIKKNSYDAYKAGKLKDYQITADDIETYVDNNEYYGLICSLVIGEKLRKTTASVRLYKGFVDKIHELNSRGISFKKVICECVSDDGLNNAKKLGLKLVNAAHEIYEGKLNI